jgi:hypothetical protein
MKLPERSHASIPKIISVYALAETVEFNCIFHIMYPLASVPLLFLLTYRYSCDLGVYSSSNRKLAVSA